MGRHSAWDEADHPRDADGTFTDGPGGERRADLFGAIAAHYDSGAQAPAKGADKLKLAGKIVLPAGERITGSARIGGDVSTIDMAATDGPNGPRLAVAFHQGWEDGEDWQANRFADLADDDLDDDDRAEYEAAKNGPGVLDDGLTVRLSPDSARELADTLDDARSALKKADKDQDALWKEIEPLQERDTDYHAKQVADAREKLAYAEERLASGARSESPTPYPVQVQRARNGLAGLEANPPEGLSPAEKSRLTELQARADRFENEPLFSGAIPGEWGEIAFAAQATDTDGYLLIGVRDRDRPDYDLEIEASEGRLADRISASDIPALVKQLRRVGGTAGMDLLSG